MFGETFSFLQPAANISQNPFAGAYIVPDYDWAVQQPGMNDADVPFIANVEDNRITLDSNREIQNTSTTVIERDDFWVGYFLISYQPPNNPSLGIRQDADPFDRDNINDRPMAGVAPADDPGYDLLNTTASSAGVRKGSVGAHLFIETIRDIDFTLGASNRCRMETAPHELVLCNLSY